MKATSDPIKLYHALGKAMNSPITTPMEWLALREQQLAIDKAHMFLVGRAVMELYPSL